MTQGAVGGASRGCLRWEAARALAWLPSFSCVQLRLGSIISEICGSRSLCASTAATHSTGGGAEQASASLFAPADQGMLGGKGWDKGLFAAAVEVASARHRRRGALPFPGSRCQ